ncbi:hypothetical protein NDU88_003098 [Pleurodeles waltl]|uniref:Uncharacterized protein n=1 Tax=Pleurodeles waltl TaxID=8319 RepID=A0AAV7QDV9_PLEWA|nr:hypothetical protein NDU88_003098 [Pleurodeles waltl]
MYVGLRRVQQTANGTPVPERGERGERVPNPQERAPNQSANGKAGWVSKFTICAGQLPFFIETFNMTLKVTSYQSFLPHWNHSCSPGTAYWRGDHESDPGGEQAKRRLSRMCEEWTTDAAKEQQVRQRAGAGDGACHSHTAEKKERCFDCMKQKHQEVLGASG